VLSALGMLASPAGRTLTHTRLGVLADLDATEIDGALTAMCQDVAAELRLEGAAAKGLEVERSLDLRYRGQSHTLNIHWRGGTGTAEAFHRRHEEAYGHRLDLPVELVNLRVRVRAPALGLLLPPLKASPGSRTAVARTLEGHGDGGPVPVYSRHSLAGSDPLPGPAVIADPVATLWVAPGWHVVLDPAGNLWLARNTVGLASRPAVLEP